MAWLDKGDFACTTGLSKRLLDTLTGVAPYDADGNAARQGFSNPLTGAQLDMLKAMAWSQAQAVADQLNTELAAWPYFFVKNFSNQSIPHDQQTTVQFTSVMLNNGSGYSGGVFTVPAGQAGLYEFEASVLLNPAGSVNVYRSHIVQANLTTIGGGIKDSITAFADIKSFALVQLAVGQNIRVWVHHTNGAGTARDVQGDGNFTYFKGKRIA